MTWPEHGTAATASLNGGAWYHLDRIILTTEGGAQGWDISH